MAYKNVIRAKTKNLMTDEMFTSVGFTKQSDGSWYIPNSTAVNMKVMWENTEGIAGPLVMNYYGKSPNPNAGGVLQFLATYTDGSLQYLNGTGVSDAWTYNEWIPTNATRTVANIKWINITGRPVYLRDVMFEWGSKPTPYTPYNYLQSNKRMIKVSNVCQLLDSNYYDVTTLAGVTFTNNENGTWTVDGTTTGVAYTNNLFRHVKSYSLFGHKLLLAAVSNDDNIVMEFKYIRKDGTGAGFSYYKEHIYTITEIENYDHFEVRLMVLKTGVTFTNTQVIPQLFDLTEMYGAGNEPKTVAEFKQKFPNDLYNYSPKCWLTSYKSTVICKTKNLFNINKVTALFQFVNEVDYPFVYDGKFVTIATDGIEARGSVVLKLPVHLLPGKYTFSFTTGLDFVDATNKAVSIIARKLPLESSSSIITGVRITQNEQRCSMTITVDEESDWYFGCLTAAKGYVICWDIQVEQGSTPTEYVPYQHL